MARDEHRTTGPKDRRPAHAKNMRRAKHAGDALVEHSAKRYSPLRPKTDERESRFADDDRPGG